MLTLNSLSQHDGRPLGKSKASCGGGFIIVMSFRITLCILCLLPDREFLFFYGLLLDHAGRPSKTLTTQPFMYNFTFAWGLFVRCRGHNSPIFFLPCPAAYISAAREKKRRTFEDGWVFLLIVLFLYCFYFYDIFPSKNIYPKSPQTRHKSRCKWW